MRHDTGHDAGRDKGHDAGRDTSHVTRHVTRLQAIVAACLMAATVAFAQVVPIDPDWREAQVPPPPTVKLEGLIPLEIPGSTLRYGVDPTSVSVGNDGVVRYVVIASSTSGAMNAIYEGIRCATGDYRVYARRSEGGWTIAKDSPWRSLHDQPRSRHSLLIARSGACQEHATGRSAAQIVRDLSAPAATRYLN